MFKLKNVIYFIKFFCYKGMVIYNMNFFLFFSFSFVDIFWELKKEIINLKYLIKGYIKKKYDEIL